MAVAIDKPPGLVVEATSLASVLELASNPQSQLPSSLARAAPLVLYIARVPGSRDVFLTPIKPREKVVTASDVQSSLYYVHIHGTRPDPQSNPLAQLRPEVSCMLSVPALPRRPDDMKGRPQLPRRPVPPSSPPSLVDDQPPALPARPMGVGQLIAQKSPVPSRLKSRNLVSDAPVLPRRPLPPTPPHDDGDDGKRSLHDDNLRLLTRETHVDVLNNPYIRDYSDYQEEQQLLELDCRPNSGTLTLIRRDPVSQEQWNIATIHDPPIAEVSSSSFHVPTAQRRTKKGGAPLYLDILNPGYSQFIPPSSRTDTQRSDSSSGDVEPPSEGVFRRRLYMPGSKYAEHGYSKSWHRKQSSASTLGSSERSSAIASTSRGERHSIDMGSVNKPPRADRRANGYTFMSPWDSHCDFTTGATGRTLKCRHHLPPSAGRPVRSVEISELRFNLPTPAKSTSSGLLSRTSYFSERPHLFQSLSEDGSQSPTVVINEDGRIDLTLGQERAGGGVGGKQAKLGKLIIQPDGFGMLDLLVASNIGLWFRAWEQA